MQPDAPRVCLATLQELGIELGHDEEEEEEEERKEASPAPKPSASSQRPAPEPERQLSKKVRPARPAAHLTRSAFKLFITHSLYPCFPCTYR